jgi:hypothetical protein
MPRAKWVASIAGGRWLLWLDEEPLLGGWVPNCELVVEFSSEAPMEGTFEELSILASDGSPDFDGAVSAFAKLAGDVFANYEGLLLI